MSLRIGNAISFVRRRARERRYLDHWEAFARMECVAEWVETAVGDGGDVGGQSGGTLHDNA